MNVFSLSESSHLNIYDWLGHAWIQHLVGEKNYVGVIRNYITSIHLNSQLKTEDALSYSYL